MQLIIDTTGAALKKRNDCFHIITKERSNMVSPHRVTSLIVTADILVSTGAIRLAAGHDIPIFLMNTHGDIYARLWSPYFGSTAELRRRQVRFCDRAEGLDWVCALFALKGEGQVQNLRYLANRRPAVAGMTAEATHEIGITVDNLMALRGAHVAEHRDVLMGMEGSISRRYWQCISAGMQDIYTFEGRSRRPAADLFNAGLNYAYGMTYSWVERAVMTAGLDPYLGVLHTDQYRRPSFVFDMIEPFRPLVDRWWIDLCVQSIPAMSWVRVKDRGVYLDKAGKQQLIPSYHAHMESRVVFNGKTARIQDHIYAYAAEIAKQINTLEK